jgi:hypothetical protein
MQRCPVTGPEHYRQAEQLAGQAAAVMDFEHGIYSSMSTSERLQRRACLLAEAQVHATLAQAGATALSGITLTLPDGSDLAADWNSAIFQDWRADDAPDHNGPNWGVR